MRDQAKNVLKRSPRLYDTARLVRGGFRSAGSAAKSGAGRLGTASRRSVGLLSRRAAIQRYFAEHEVTKLHLGSGEAQRAGWLNSDLEPLDRGTIFLNAAARMPFAECTFDYVYAEHMIEHLPYKSACSMLEECRRILRPGGRIRIATPDLEKLIRVYDDRDNPDPLQVAYIDWIARTFIGRDRAGAIFVLNNAFRAWGHQFLFDEETLTAAMAAAGFIHVCRRGVGESEDPHLRDLESHGSLVENDAANEFETFVLEAERPPVRTGPGSP
jgi:predicted SAM-dependent methyltransferase